MTLINRRNSKTKVECWMCKDYISMSLTLDSCISCHTLQRCIRYDIRISKQQKHSPNIWERRGEIFWTTLCHFCIVTVWLGCVHWLTGWHWLDFQVMIQLGKVNAGLMASIWYVKIWNITCKTRRIILKHWNSVLRLHHRQMWRIRMNLIWLILSHSVWN